MTDHKEEQSASREKSVSDLAAGVVMSATASHEAGCDCDLCFDGDALCEHVKGMEEELVRLRAAESRCKVLEGALRKLLKLHYGEFFDGHGNELPTVSEARKALGDHQ